MKTIGFRKRLYLIWPDVHFDKKLLNYNLNSFLLIHPPGPTSISWASPQWKFCQWYLKIITASIKLINSQEFQWAHLKLGYQSKDDQKESTLLNCRIMKLVSLSKNQCCLASTDCQRRSNCYMLYLKQTAKYKALAIQTKPMGAFTTRWQYWSQIKSCLFWFLTQIFFSKQNKTSFSQDL